MAPANDKLSGERVASPTITIPPYDTILSNGPKTPKTPADEGLEFFESAVVPGDAPIRVYELKLSPDGGPSKDKSVRVYVLLRGLPGR